jgi:hypothetical protein
MYTYDVHRAFPIALGSPVTVDVYGADEPCVPLERLFTEVIDGTTWDSSYCFTTQRSYAYTVNHVQIQGTIVSTEVSRTNAICAGCGN